jgi:hypothetical protein
VHIEMRQPIGDAVAQYTATLGIWFGCGKLKLRAIELKGNIGRKAVTRRQTIHSSRDRGAGLKKLSAGCMPA